MNVVAGVFLGVVLALAFSAVVSWAWTVSVIVGLGFLVHLAASRFRPEVK